MRPAARRMCWTASGSSSFTPTGCSPGPSVPMRISADCAATCGSEPLLVEDAARHVQHMQKALTQMNVKLQHVISDITGATGLAIIDAVIGGERDPVKLAQLRDPRIRADTSMIARSLEGHWREEHLFELAQARDLYRVYQDKIAECDGKLEALLEEWDDSGDPRPPLGKPRRSKRAKNAPAFDVRSHLYRMTGWT